MHDAFHICLFFNILPLQKIVTNSMKQYELDIYTFVPNVGLNLEAL